eukprot:SAG11_NODE_10844_length_802_cov_1.132290_1_plen_42_part_10
MCSGREPASDPIARPIVSSYITLLPVWAALLDLDLIQSDSVI